MEPEHDPYADDEPTGDPADDAASDLPAPDEAPPLSSSIGPPIAKPPTPVGPPPIARPPTPASAAAGYGWDPGPAISRVNAPALVLAIVTALAMLLGVLNLVGALVQVAAPELIIDFYRNANLPSPGTPGQVRMGGVFGLATNTLGMLVGALIIYGAIQMRRLRSHTLALVASGLALVPCVGPCCCVTLPFGIWSLIVLMDPDVKYVFQLNAEGKLPPGYA